MHAPSGILSSWRVPAASVYGGWKHWYTLYWLANNDCHKSTTTPIAGFSTDPYDVERRINAWHILGINSRTQMGLVLHAVKIFWIWPPASTFPEHTTYFHVSGLPMSYTSAPRILLSTLRNLSCFRSSFKHNLPHWVFPNPNLSSPKPLVPLQQLQCLFLQPPF